MLRRSVEDRETGEKRGVVGTAQLLCEHTIASQQPVAAFDWSSDKPGAWVAASLDQTLRVGMVSRVNTL